MIDAHCHLDDAQFANDLDAIITRAKAAGVAALITAGTDVESSAQAVALADQLDIVYAVVGIHPQHAETFDSHALAEIRALAQHRKVVGIGETGLDLHYPDGAPRAVQEKVFAAQLDLAEELGMPVVIHDRDADQEIMEILRHLKKPRGMLHCFSGALEMAQAALALGYYISFAGSVTFENARGLQDIARQLPLDRLIVETDAPYLSPHPLRGKRNEPANVARTAAKIAELKNIAATEVEVATTKNSATLFGMKGFLGS